MNQFGRMPIFEFRDLIRGLGYNHILLRDKRALWYHAGIDEERPDYPSLIAFLKAQIRQIKPSKVICVGTSAGGYAAMVLGHELKADYVHAFGPQTYLMLENILGDKVNELAKLETAVQGYLDLAQLLQKWNGKTTYYIHYSHLHGIDQDFALYLEGMPGVVCVGYPTEKHAVSVFLGKENFLESIMRLENQANLSELAVERFPDTVITGTPPKSLSDLGSR